MVRENVAWRVYDSHRIALTECEIARVCAACVTPSEEAKAMVDSVCKGCGQPMRLSARSRRVRTDAPSVSGERVDTKSVRAASCVADAKNEGL